MKTRTITVEKLKAIGACADGIESFKEYFGESVSVEDFLKVTLDTPEDTPIYLLEDAGWLASHFEDFTIEERMSLFDIQKWPEDYVTDFVDYDPVELSEEAIKKLGDKYDLEFDGD